MPAGDADVSRAVLEPVLNGLGRAGLTTHARPPEVMFRQGKVDSCVFSGVASAFSSLGDDKGAAVLAGLAEASAQCANPMAFLEKIVCQRTAWDVQGVSEGAYDVLEAGSDATCIQIKCSDGAVNHSIVTVGEWIFDSNETSALPLCKASLDRCAGQDATFVGCVKVLKLIPSKKLVKALLKKHKK